MTKATAQTIAWQGITVVVPASWSLVAASGDASSGSARLDRTGAGDVDAGRDAPLGVDIRWSDVKQAQTAEMLDKRIRPLIDHARKSAKRANVEAETSVSAYSDKRRRDRDVVREFRWRADGAGLGRIWRCATCGRLVIAQVYGAGGGKLFDERARAVLASIACHGDEDGWTRWALYGLDTALPSDFMLSGQQLMNIYLELRFTRGRGKGRLGDTLTVEQWSAANVQLKGAYLDEWLAGKGNQSLQRSLRVEKVEAIVHGHGALEIVGERAGFGYWLCDGAKQLMALTAPVRRYAACGWECADSNRVTLVQSLSARGEGIATVREVAERTRCHGGS